MLESKIKRTRICEGQNEILRIKAVVVSSEEYPGISGFYEDISERAMRSCAEYVGEMARADYIESREEGILFSKYYYFLFCDLLYFNPHLAVIGLRVGLKKGNSLLESASYTQWWALADQKMIPPKTALKEQFEWQKGFGKIRRKTPVMLVGRGVFADLRGGRRYLGDLREKSQ